MQVTLISGAAALNLAPSGVSAGVDLRKGATPGRMITTATQAVIEGFGDFIDTAVVLTTGDGTITSLGIKLWGFAPATQLWHPMGSASSGADAARGLLNNGVALGPIPPAAAGIVAMERVSGLMGFTRGYAQISSLTGAGNVNVILVSRG